jgi:hypothetical protein
MQSRTITIIHSCLKTSVFISHYSRCLNWWPWVIHASKCHCRDSLMIRNVPGMIVLHALVIRCPR